MANEPDLSFVAPHRREEVRRRIDAVQRYVAGGDCREIAAELGMPPRSLRVLARVLRRTGDPLQMPGVRIRGTRSTDLSGEQIDILREALRNEPGGVLQDAARGAERIAEARGVPMPTRATIRARMTMLMRELPDRLPAADLVVDHVVIDVPATDPRAGRTPLLTAVLDVRARAPVGLALSAGLPTSAATARALSNALGRTPRGDGPPRPTIDLTALPAGDRAEFDGPLATAGFRVVAGELVRSATGRAFRRVVGPLFASAAIRTTSVWRPDTRLRHHARSLRQPMAMAEAEEMLRARMPVATSSALGGLEDWSVRILLDDLGRLGAGA